MSRLVEQLKKEHEVLSELLVSISEGKTGSDSKGMLLKAKGALLAHLSREDKELYPLLKKAGLKDENIQSNLDTFGKDMEAISAFVLDFFHNIENDLYSPGDYARSFGKLVSTLKSRIRREENILYPLYDSCL